MLTDSSGCQIVIVVLHQGMSIVKPAGSFPNAGPVTYLTDDPQECLVLLAGHSPPARTWFHGTTERVACLACVQGLAPGCWTGAGGECCGVLGYDSRAAFLERRAHLWIVEIYGPAVDTDVKAWWVPPSCVRGIWRREVFLPAGEVAAVCDELFSEPRTGCPCGLSAVCSSQQALWRSTWLNR